MIRVQQEPFDAQAEAAALCGNRTDIGALVTFTGLVRDMVGQRRVRSMTLEHYPGMTEKKLREIEEEARQRWPLSDSLIIHRYGTLKPGEPIVLVITASAHRQAAFEAASFLVDYLKTQAPFWKLESGPDSDKWVEARAEDEEFAARWDKK